LAHISKKQEEEIKEVKKDFKIDPNTPFDEAIKQIKAESVKEAIEALKAEQNKESSQASYYENLINE
jgi:F0F1-type ATP synthase membrane subunit b/b'